MGCVLPLQMTGGFDSNNNLSIIISRNTLRGHLPLPLWLISLFTLWLNARGLLRKETDDFTLLPRNGKHDSHRFHFLFWIFFCWYFSLNWILYCAKTKNTHSHSHWRISGPDDLNDVINATSVQLLDTFARHLLFLFRSLFSCRRWNGMV